VFGCFPLTFTFTLVHPSPLFIMAPPHPKMTADYLFTELGLVEGKETFEVRSLGD
jgi:hypothetical protein